MALSDVTLQIDLATRVLPAEATSPIKYLVQFAILAQSMFLLRVGSF